ncbi:MAG: Fe-S oxidoreductase [Armatimonadetes bacterium]|nr:Fe-S oxidoreductase [Armatimonadota bacterium]
MGASICPETVRECCPTTAPMDRELARRMDGPQRYRLLQGYPMPALMPAFHPGQTLDPVKVDTARPLIVGVLPHTSCAPTLAGCGFCTFPHEPFRASEVRRTVAAVEREIRLRRDSRPELSERRVDAVYLGGGTANLTPPDALESLCRTLSRAFDLHEAEVTLEGAPVFFLKGRHALLEVLRQSLPTRRLRISMGVQTFDPDQIRGMGREAFGDRHTVAAVVESAHARGFTTSGDFLLNLPGQSREAMLSDTASAMAMGLDQICLYHLVLFRGLGTPWARNPEKLRALPALEAAFANWQAVRDLLLQNGYVQTTLTNFERSEVHRSGRGYLYEECSFRPELYDGAGFGPAALSCSSDLAGSMAVKWMNEGRAADYARAVDERAIAFSHRFVYGQKDLKLLYLTRKLPLLRIPRAAYREAYGGDPLEDLAEEFSALDRAGLTRATADAVELTPRGMFYADAVAGLLASGRVRELRGVRAEEIDANEAGGSFMG